MKSFSMFGIKFIDEASNTKNKREQGNFKSFKFYPEQKCIVSINNGNVIGEVKYILFRRVGNISGWEFISHIFMKKNCLVKNFDKFEINKNEVEIKRLSLATRIKSNFSNNFRLATENEKLMYIKTNMLID